MSLKYIYFYPTLRHIAGYVESCLQLETLRAFPFDKIKLDRSFMNEVETSQQAKAIIRAILALGQSLDVPVLAEGVEIQDQLDILQKEGCDEAQGYLLGRPRPVTDLDHAASKAEAA